VAEAINGHFQRTVAATQDSASISVEMPKGSSEKIIDAMTQIEKLEIEPDQVAKVIIDPSGVIVLGNKVRISAVALTHGSVTVRIAESASVSQPNPFTQVVNPLASNPGAPIGLGLALSGAASQNAAAHVVQTASQIPVGTALPFALTAGATPAAIGTALINLRADATPAQIAAAISGIPGGAGTTAAIPAGATLAQIVTAIGVLPAGTTPQVIAAAINAIVPVVPAQNPAGTAPQNLLSQAPSMINAALNPNSALQQATIVNETN
ncbi:MAG: flagellar basal body P-ring protein FlgI, partial [Proteobacteria bacterium]|nr:flagellar basal body P-ring protein FlgI [Pseudomonadota bacterium]